LEGDLVIQNASCDACVDDTVYEVTAKPGISGVDEQQIYRLNEDHNVLPCGERPALLHPSTSLSYAVRQRVQFHLKDTPLTVVCNTKSSLGRVDLDIENFGSKGLINELPAGYEGELWSFLSPGSFKLGLSAGEPLVQFRLSVGEPEYLKTSELKKLAAQGDFITKGEARIEQNHLSLGLDINSCFLAKQTGKPINLAMRDHYQADDFFAPAPVHDGYVYLEPQQFMLARSVECISIPHTHCAELLPYVAGYGKFLAHYAGFFDAGFYGHPVFEIRNFGRTALRFKHGDPIGMVRFQEMSVVPTYPYSVPSPFQREENHYYKQTNQQWPFAKYFAQS